MTGIPELALLEDIEDISDEYLRQFGQRPVNLSTWNPSPAVLGMRAPRPPHRRKFENVNYAFSYELTERADLLAKLGYNDSNAECLITHSGSSSLVNAVNWLRLRSCKRVLVVAPRYFTVPHALIALGLHYRVVHLRRTAEGFRIPVTLEEEFGECDALWLTNPIYCTSVDFRQDDRARLLRLVLDLNLPCVIDECLAQPGHYLGPKFLAAKSVVVVHAPHKAVCVNGLKFATIVHPRTEQRHFDQWADIWNGCLPPSSVQALRHFLSNDFDDYRREFDATIAMKHRELRKLLAGYPNLSIDHAVSGYLISVYVPGIPANRGLELGFLKEATWATGATFIAGIRNELDPDAGLSFRVNLAALDTEAIGGLARLCAWLGTHVGDGGSSTRISSKL